MSADCEKAGTLTVSDTSPEHSSTSYHHHAQNDHPYHPHAY